MQYFTWSRNPVVEHLGVSYLLGVVYEVPVGQHHALGDAGGPRGEREGGLGNAWFKKVFAGNLVTYIINYLFMLELGKKLTRSLSTSICTGDGSPGKKIRIFIYLLGFYNVCLPFASARSFSSDSTSNPCLFWCSLASMEMAVRGGPGTERVVVHLVVLIIVSPFISCLFRSSSPWLGRVCPRRRSRRTRTGVWRGQAAWSFKGEMFIVVGFKYSFNNREKRNKNRSQSATKHQHNTWQQQQLQQHHLQQQRQKQQQYVQ